MDDAVGYMKPGLDVGAVLKQAIEGGRVQLPNPLPCASDKLVLIRNEPLAALRFHSPRSQDSGNAVIAANTLFGRGHATIGFLLKQGDCLSGKKTGFRLKILTNRQLAWPSDRRIKAEKC